MKSSTVFLLMIVLAWGVWPLAQPVRAELPIANVERQEAVDFNQELMPVLRRKCLACHHSKEAEGGLILEKFSQVVAGGDSGPGIKPNHADESLVFTRAAGIEEPLMPPEGNSVGAETLTPQELGLLKLWIEQGAPGSDQELAEQMEWQSIPDSVRPIYAIDVSPDGRFAVFGRGNRAVVIDLTNEQATAQLADPALGDRGIADVDVIQAVAFSPAGNRIATGGFRTVRIWRKADAEVAPQATPLSKAAGPIALNMDQTQAAFVNAIGDIELWDLANFQRLQTLAGQGATISGLVWNQVTGLLFVADTSGRVAVWNPQTAEQIASLETATRIRQLAVSQQGTQLATLTGSRQIALLSFAASTAEQAALLSTVGEPLDAITSGTAVAMIADSQLAIATADRGVLIVNLANREVVRTLDHGAVVASLAVSADGALLATGGLDGRTKLWNLADGAALRTLEGTPTTALELATWQRDLERQQANIEKLNGQTAGLEASLKTENEALAKFTAAREEAAKALAENREKQTAAMTVVSTSQTQLAEAEQRIVQANQTITATTMAEQAAVEKRKQIDSQVTELVTAEQQADAAVSQAEQQLAKMQQALETAQANAAKVKEQLAAQQALQKQLDEATAKAIAEREAAMKMADEAEQLAEKTRKEIEAQQAAVTKAAETTTASEQELAKRAQALAASEDAQRVAAEAVPKHLAQIEQEQQQLKIYQEHLAQVNSLIGGPSQAVVALQFDPQGSQLVSAHRDGSLRIYQVADGQPRQQFSSTKATEFAGVSWVGDQVCGWESPGKAELFSTTTGWELERTIGGFAEPLLSDRVTALNFHRDGLLLAVGSGEPSRFGEIKVFATDTGELLRSFDQPHSDVVLCLSFSPAGDLLASAAADKTIRLLDIASGETTKTLEGHTHHVLSLDWEANGQRLASASADRSVKIWDVEIARATRTIGGFPEELSALDFVAATPQLVAASINGSIRLSDANNGNTIRGFNAGGEFIYALTTSPDGKLLLAGGQSGKLRIWNVADGALVREVE